MSLKTCRTLTVKRGLEVNTEDVAREASLEREDLNILAEQFRTSVEIKDRRYGFPAKTYECCFVGTEAVAQMVKSGIASHPDEAVCIGNMLLEAGIFRHVLGEHAFKNEALFYRFSEDEDHGKAAKRGDGGAVSWADFLPAVVRSDDRGMNLQPSVPERDPRLAEFEQVDLEAIGVSPLDEHNMKLLDHVHPKAWIDPTPKPKYNLVVIGAGAGGLVSAAAAAGVGGRVALIESHLLGGDCLNVGCVPSKALLRCAKAAAAVRDAGHFGIRVHGDVEVDFPAIMERMRRLRAGIGPHDSARRYTEDLGVDVFIGRARFTGQSSVEVNGKTLQFSKAVIATGGTAAVPDIPGLSQAPYLTNASVFNLTELPRRLGVIGAGPIGMELAQAFQRFGADVTVFARDGKILPKEDRDAAALVEASVRRDGMSLVLDARYERVESSGKDAPVTVVLDRDRRFEFDALLVATGRKPTVKGLGLEAAGVRFDERMGVEVDDRLQTSNPNVYAVGDVASRYQFTHMADFMARMVVRNALFFGRDRVSKLLVPWATYTDPEVAHVGLYPHDLEERGIAFATYRRDFKDVDRSILDGATDGFVKIHTAKDSDAILGATIVGEHAGDMISEITLAMRSGTGLGTLANVIHPYPTAAEAIRQAGDAYNRTRLTPTVKKVFNRLMALQRR